ncbi:MAG TPA: helix-turn-helix transcriptional regulator [Roseiflexaceae bacterium]|nr:helix-turn-helix transcriptional regulator [Roseiflexaceae bacterium]
MWIKLRVRELMQERNMTVAQLQEKADIANNTARSLWRGNMSRVDLRILKRVADALGVSPLELFTLTEDDPGYCCAGASA